MMRDDPQYRQLVQKNQRRLDIIQEDNNNDDKDRRTQNSKREEQRGHVRKAVHVVKQEMSRTLTNVSPQLDQSMVQLMVNAMDVAELYSPPRIAEMTSNIGLRVGWSMDITTQDSDGRPWDFNIPEMRNRAARRVLTDRPLLLIGSPMCTIHSMMNNINHSRMPAEMVQERFAYARKHSKFAASLYKLQVQGGRYFLHEHPESASSWQEQCIQEVLKLQGVEKAIGDQCRYGLKEKGADGEGPARTTTGFMTNSPCIALQLQRRCPNRKGYTIHRHVQLDGGKAKAAQIYPPGLCKAVCQGLIEQIAVDRQGQYLLMNMDYDDKQTSGEMKQAAKRLEEKYDIVEEDQEEELEIAWDDVSGATLDPKQVRSARQEEVDYVKNMQLYEKVPIRQCFETIGKAPHHYTVDRHQ